MNLFIFKPKNEFFFRRASEETETTANEDVHRPTCKKEAQNDDDHRRTWRSVFKVGNATTTTTFLKKNHFRCSSTENPTKCEIMQILCKFLVTNFLKNRQN